MKKIVLEYDEASGNIYNSTGEYLWNYIGLNYEEYYQPNIDSLGKLKELKAMGIPTEDLKELRELGLI